MVFHRLRCLISTKVVNEVADDIVEIAELASDKQRLRQELIRDRLQKSNQHAVLSSYEINEMVRSLSGAKVKPDEIAVILKRIGRRVKKHYDFICGIIKTMR